MKRDICRRCAGPLVVTGAGVANHCLRCARETAKQIVTVPAALFSRLREQVETTEIVRSEER